MEERIFRSVAPGDTIDRRCEELARNVVVRRWAVDLVVENGFKERLDGQVESNGRMVKCDCPVNLEGKKQHC